MLLFKKISSFGLLFFLSISSCELFARSSPDEEIYDAPWYTGPLLAPAAVCVPLGHMNFELYSFSTKTSGFFDKHWKLVDSIASKSLQFTPVATYGLSDLVDTQWALPYTINKTEDAKKQDIGDASVLLGLQLLRQDKSKWLPNVRFTVLEVMPTGKYDGLNPIDKGTGVTGSGSYQTGFTLNFEHLLHLYGVHYLSTRFSTAYVYAAPHQLRGFNLYGGNMDTEGRMRPGALQTYDIAGELTLTKNIVAVMEGYFFHRSASFFKGNPGRDENGNPLSLNSAAKDEITIAPALEFNFSEHVGLIGGFWYAIKGKDSPDFKSVVLAINLFW